MKTPIALMSAALLSSALLAASITAYSAWKSLTGEAELSPIAQSPSAQPTAIPPIPSAQPVVTITPVASPASPSVTPTVATTVATTASANRSIQPTLAPWSQSENDYLYDLSQALQPLERQRLSSTEQIEIGRKVQSWLEAGADYWGTRDQFDRVYRGLIAGDYGHNREVYINFATRHFAPNYGATLTQPPTILEIPETTPLEAPEEFPIANSDPQPDPYQQPVPYQHPYFDPYFDPPPHAEPYPQPYFNPPYSYSYPYPDTNPYPYPNQPPTSNRPTDPRIPRNPDANPEQSTGIPNLTEISIQSENF